MSKKVECLHCKESFNGFGDYPTCENPITGDYWALLEDNARLKLQLHIAKELLGETTQPEGKQTE